jgi:hypothetical protein
VVKCLLERQCVLVSSLLCIREFLYSNLCRETACPEVFTRFLITSSVATAAPIHIILNRRFVILSFAIRHCVVDTVAMNKLKERVWVVVTLSTWNRKVPGSNFRPVIACTDERFLWLCAVF